MREEILNEATMAVFSTALIENPVDAARRLADFRLTVSQIFAIRDSARAAADDASPLMPMNALLLCCLFLISWTVTAPAADCSKSPIKDSKQVVLSITPHWNSKTARLQRHWVERRSPVVLP